jgi:hypothetical protein
MSHSRRSIPEGIPIPALAIIDAEACGEQPENGVFSGFRNLSPPQSTVGPAGALMIDFCVIEIAPPTNRCTRRPSALKTAYLLEQCVSTKAASFAK